MWEVLTTFSQNVVSAPIIPRVAQPLGYSALMEFLFFGLLLAGFIVYVAVTKWSALQAHLYYMWVALALSGVVGVLHAVFR